MKNLFHISYFEVVYMLYRRFCFGNEIPINCLFTKWKWTFILDFAPWSWGTLTMSFVDKATFMTRGTCFFFLSWMGRTSFFNQVQNNFSHVAWGLRGVGLALILWVDPFPKARRGCFSTRLRKRSHVTRPMKAKALWQPQISSTHGCIARV